MTFSAIRTERLVLRDLIDADADDLVEYRNDEQTASLQDWPLPYTRDRARVVIGGAAAADWPVSGGWYQVAIEYDGRLAGDLGIGRSADGLQAEIGYTLAPWARGRGLATEAAAAILDLLFAEGVHRVHAGVDPANAASAKVLQRLGFRHEGRFLSALYIRDRWYDDDRYGLLADEWRTRSSG
jgi:aminoglycoside 6'-N-acetyltransferase